MAERSVIRRGPMPPSQRFLVNFRRKAAMVFSGFYGQNYPGWRIRRISPGSDFDYEKEVGEAWMNSAVMLGITYVQTLCAEARLQVTREDAKGNKVPIVGHPMIELLERPNDQYSGKHLWDAIRFSRVLDGNAYVRIIRGKSGKPIQLWWIPHFRVAPQWSPDGSQFIDHYTYLVDGKPFRIEVSDMIHFRVGQDPLDERLGFSPLKACFREIYSDNEAATYTAAVLRNGGVPSVILSPNTDSVDMDWEKAKDLKGHYQDQMTGEGRGGAFVSTLPVKVDPLGFSPEQLTLDKIRQVPELRIAQAMSLPAALLQFSGGMQRTTFANMAMWREMAYRHCVIPNQRGEADDLQLQLLPQMSRDLSEEVSFDYSDVTELQDDQDAKHERVRSDFQAGIVLRSEARAELGLQSDPVRDNVYFTDITLADPSGEHADAEEETPGSDVPINAPMPEGAEPGSGEEPDDEDGGEGEDSFGLRSSWTLAEFVEQDKRQFMRDVRRNGWMESFERGIRSAKSAEDDEGHWVTINGSHVFIDGAGTITRGPAALLGKQAGRDVNENAGHKRDVQAVRQSLVDRHDAGEISDEQHAEADRPHADHEAVIDAHRAHLMDKGKLKLREGMHWATPEEVAASRPTIKPAWKHIQLADDPDSELIGIAKDEKHRDQYAYSAEHSKAASVAKFARIEAFDREATKLADRAKSDVTAAPASRKDSALAVYIISQTGFRPGSTRDTGAAKEAFGVSTLTAEHVTVEGDTVHFAFPAKKGTYSTATVRDPFMASEIEKRIEAHPEGPIFETNNSKMLNYMHSIDGQFKVKDFRTWQGTSKAREVIASMPEPATEAEFSRQRNEVGKAVAKHLCNTPDVALKDYIDPRVFQVWRLGRAASEDGSGDGSGGRMFTSEDLRRYAVVIAKVESDEDEIRSPATVAAQAAAMREFVETTHFDRLPEDFMEQTAADFPDEDTEE